MTGLELLQRGFVSFFDGLWWGLRDTVGALSMNEGYSRGFRQMGIETAERVGGSGPKEAANIACDLLKAIGLDAQQNGTEILISSCPLWDRILERGLEYSLHIEEICWIPMLEGIAEKTGTKAFKDQSLRLAYVEKAGVEYKKKKAETAREKGFITDDDYNAQIASLDEKYKQIEEKGHYRFE
ncbi:MAG: hypothetical protein JSW61_15085 [Candidatus Thorarchaeota archaeon]|nr:MAG: hypothetical protein JSW61_15085 [Candidatus Thorarchaeota archaeon]